MAARYQVLGFGNAAISQALGLGMIIRPKAIGSGSVVKPNSLAARGRQTQCYWVVFNSYDEEDLMQAKAKDNNKQRSWNFL